MNIFHAQFSTGQVVEATAVSNATLQSWLKRKLIVSQQDSPIVGGGSPGVHRRYSFFTVMEIAIAKALIDAGLSNLSAAFQAASRFAHIGCGEIGDRPARMPSIPFDTLGSSGMTLLCVAGDRSAITLWRPGKDPLAEIRHELQRPGGFVLIEADPIFNRVVTLLGYQPHEVLQLAYRGEIAH